MSDGFYFGGSAAQSDTQQSNNPFMQPKKQQPQQPLQQQFNSFAPPPPTPHYYQTQLQQQQYYNPQQQQQQQQQQQLQQQQQQQQQQFYNPQQQQQFFTPTPPLQQQQQQQQKQHTITWRGILSSFVPSSELEGDKPLLEELDVNLNHIRRKTIAVLNPLSIMKPLDEDLMTDGDLAGPFIFAFILGMSLLVLNGRVHFGFIYGLGLLGWGSIWLILNAMSETSQIPTIRCASILGYCILPMVILSLVSLVLPLKGGLPGLVAGATTVGWSTLASSNMFVSSLQMKDQRILVAYPVGLFYFSFALMTIF